jgi:hypothetical protein
VAISSSSALISWLLNAANRRQLNSFQKDSPENGPFPGFFRIYTQLISLHPVYTGCKYRYPVDERLDLTDRATDSGGQKPDRPSVGALAEQYTPEIMKARHRKSDAWV